MNRKKKRGSDEVKQKILCFLLVISFLFSLSACLSPRGEEVSPKTLTWAIGAPLPKAEDFFDSLPDGYTVGFADESPFAHLQLGKNAVKLCYKGEKGRRRTVEATLVMINDTEPPVMEGVRDLIVYIGEGVAYRSGIAVRDNCGGEIALTVDSSAVNTAEEGKYPVTYYATDAVGNTSTAMITVHVYEQKITEEMLYAEIDPLIYELGLIGISRSEQARKIYNFVNTSSGIAYVDTSDKASWVRAAYFALTERKGDCFSYFALSKAFFERLGIPNLDVQRLPGYTTDTHYWSMINIGTADVPQWYHYDATRLRNVYYPGYLLTDRQVQAFSRFREYFYLYDTTCYPSTSTVEMIHRPDLEPYYD
jgi:hypothetical protein